MIGLRFRERLQGTYHLISSPLDERPLTGAFEGYAGVKSILKNQVIPIRGEISLPGFADRAAFAGTLVLKLLREQRLPYAFTFVGNDGNAYRFFAQKNYSILQVADRHGMFAGSIYDAAGSELARASCRFDVVRDLYDLVRSLRVSLGG
jgi:hypothetical protein